MILLPPDRARLLVRAVPLVTPVDPLAKLRDPLASPAPDGRPRPVRVAPNATRPMAAEPTPLPLDVAPFEAAGEAASDDEAPTRGLAVSQADTTIVLPIHCL